MNPLTLNRRHALGLALGTALPAWPGGAHASPAPQGAVPRRLPRERWSFQTGARVVSSPIAHRGLILVGSDDHHLYALDAGSGRLRWAYRTGGPVSGTPTAVGDQVVVMSYDGRLHAVDLATGQARWKHATEGERRFEARGLHGSQPRTQTVADPFDVYLSRPAWADGLLVFGSGDGQVRALDAETGALRWAHRAGEVVHASPAVAAGRVIVGDWASRLWGLDLASGRELWRFQAGTDSLMANQQGFQSSATVDPALGLAFVGCRDSHCYAIDIASGQERWRFATGASWVVGTPAVQGGRVVFATSDSSRIHIVEAASGQPLVQQQTLAYLFASPTVAGDVLLLGVLNGSVEARDWPSGDLLWTWRSPAARANRGWVLTAEGRFNGALNFASNWREAMAVGFERQCSVGSVFSTPLAHEGLVVFGCADGRVVALG